MKTTRILHFAAILLATLYFYSCENFLDREPISSLPEKNMWKTTREVQAGINDIYFNFRNTMRNNFFYWGELRADNFEVKTPGQSDLDKVIGNVLTSDLSVTLWTSLYKTINSANAAIKHIPSSDITIEEDKKNYLAQAYAMRALCYFYAVRVWGDVPVYTEPTEDMDKVQYSFRIPAKKVLEEVVVPDLLNAEANIKESSRERKRISQYGLYAIMADVYLWLERYDDVINTVDKFISVVNNISNRPYSLATTMPELSSVLTSDLQKKASDNDDKSDEYGIAKELLFVIHFNREEWNTSSWIWSLFGGGSAGSVKLTEDFRNLMNATTRGGDLRRTYFVNGDAMRKFITQGTTISYSIWNDCEMAYPVYRATELYFMKAEALARQSKWADALALIKENILLRAAQNSSSPIYTQAPQAEDFADVEEVIDYILDEKRIDMVGEGKRWFDLVRTGRWKKLPKFTRYDENDRPYVPDYQKLFPINFRHIDENPGFIVQNPGY